MTTISSSFEDVGAGASIFVNSGDAFTYAVTGTFVADGLLEKSESLNSWETVLTFSEAASGSIEVESKGAKGVFFRFRCTDYTSGTMETALADSAKTLLEINSNDGDSVFKIEENLVTALNFTVEGNLNRSAQKYVVNAAGQAKVGAGAGAVVAAASNVGLVTVPASQTAATIVLPLPCFKVGSIITAFSLIGQIESAGGTVTVDADLRKHTAAAADVADASVGAITQVSVTADTALSSANAAKTDLAEAVWEDETYYLLVTITTGASTDVALQGAVITVTEV